LNHFQKKEETTSAEYAGCRPGGIKNNTAENSSSSLFLILQTVITAQLLSTGRRREEGWKKRGQMLYSWRWCSESLCSHSSTVRRVVDAVGDGGHRLTSRRPSTRPPALELIIAAMTTT